MMKKLMSIAMLVTSAVAAEVIDEYYYPAEGLTTAT